MKFTFGIVTSPGSNFYLNGIFQAIASDLCDDDIEVLVVGGNENKKWEHYRFIAFDETQKPGWITRKKNIITENAQYDNIVYMHDYVSIGYGWANGFKTFGDDFALCMTPIKNVDGSRFRDWTLWPDDLKHVLGEWNSKYLLPYSITNLSKYMYFSGAYWIAKKEVMKNFPLNEDLAWGESEDVEWSKRVREYCEFSINTNSTAHLLKRKDRIFNEITPEMLKKMEDYNESIQVV